MKEWNYQLVKHIYSDGDVLYSLNKYYHPFTDKPSGYLEPSIFSFESDEDIQKVVERVICDLKKMAHDLEIHEVKVVNYGKEYNDFLGVALETVITDGCEYE